MKTICQNLTFPAIKYVSIFVKSTTKAYARQHQVPLHQAQEQIAQDSGFANFHELTAVAAKRPNDGRLMEAALGVTRLEDAVFENSIMSDLDSLVEDMMSGAIAETNAYNFGVEDVEVTSSQYDPTNGILTLGLNFSYTGEQDPDRVYHGNAFYLTAMLNLFRKDGEWQLAEDEPLTILSDESDQDRDYAEEEYWRDSERAS